MRNEGQALAEYAILAAAIAGGLMTMGYQILPDFIEGLQRYLDGYYFMLNLPIP
jgi:Flp pilus assembly pilin Flp